MERLIENIQLYTSLDKDEIDLLREAVDKKSFRKNEMIFTEGKIANDIFFVTKGCVRLFYNVDGNDKTPAIENYQAIENTEIFVFGKSKINRLLEQAPKFEVIARIATENELITCQRVIASFVTKSAEERYVDLLNTQGELFQRVPQQYIASFLGVSPETLSRIKTRVFNKGIS